MATSSPFVRLFGHWQRNYTATAPHGFLDDCSFCAAKVFDDACGSGDDDNDETDDDDVDGVRAD